MNQAFWVRCICKASEDMHSGQARKEVSGKFRSNITLFTGEKNVYWIDVDDSKGPGVGQATFFFMRQ